ncbi:stalk domain-containing protein [Pelotomaculum propionicicum]|uniref:stalk domain-containing protein n=1 Tax=Pelotomaculum propionicicum TaxID=258475 RepID=UPI003B796270
MKRILLLSIVLTIGFSQIASATPTVLLDGKPVQFSSPPVIENGSVLVPLRAIFEAVGAVVWWNDATQSVTAEKGSTRIKLIVGGPSYINGQEVKLNTPAKVIGGHTMVPLRFISESLECRVDWDGARETVTIYSDMPGTAVQPSPGIYNDYQKAQGYLTILGFNTGSRDSESIDGQVVLTSSSLILFQFKMGLKITGLFDADTRSALEQCCINGRTYSEIMKLEGKQLDPLSNNPALNGRLDRSKMAVIPSDKGPHALLPEITAVGWATLVQAAAKDPNNDMNCFKANKSTSGYRSYEEQVNLFDEDGSATAAVPGNSPHGWGRAIDFNTSDPQTGRAQSYELKWLEKNAAAYSFTPLNHAVDDRSWEPYFTDGKINFYETWHWNYRP